MAFVVNGSEKLTAPRSTGVNPGKKQNCFSLSCLGSPVQQDISGQSNSQSLACLWTRVLLDSFTNNVLVWQTGFLVSTAKCKISSWVSPAVFMLVSCIPFGGSWSCLFSRLIWRTRPLCLGFVLTSMNTVFLVISLHGNERGEFASQLFSRYCIIRTKMNPNVVGVYMIHILISPNGNKIYKWFSYIYIYIADGGCTVYVLGIQWYGCLRQRDIAITY